MNLIIVSKGWYIIKQHIPINNLKNIDETQSEITQIDTLMCWWSYVKILTCHWLVPHVLMLENQIKGKSMRKSFENKNLCNKFSYIYITS